MATKEDWQAAFEMWQRDEQTRLGPEDQVSTEDLIAFALGELTGKKRARVLEFMCAYPSLCATVSEIQRIEREHPRGLIDELGDDGEPVLTPEQVERDAQRIIERASIDFTK